jgi:hypothetical protein
MMMIAQAESSFSLWSISSEVATILKAQLSETLDYQGSSLQFPRLLGPAPTTPKAYEKTRSLQKHYPQTDDAPWTRGEQSLLWWGEESNVVGGECGEGGSASSQSSEAGKKQRCARSFCTSSI